MTEIKLVPAIKKKAKQWLARPKMFNVVFLNDDSTSMSFVVDVLQSHFRLGHEDALATMLQIHHEGKAYVGPYPYEVAEQKMYDVMKLAADKKYPLTLDVEEA